MSDWFNYPKGKDLAAVSEIKNVEILADVYSKAFHQRYRCPPVLQEPDKTVLRDLLTLMSLEKASQALQAYLKSNDQWFAQKAHSLPALKSNLNTIMVGVQKKDVLVKQSHGLRISMLTNCENTQCNAVFTWQGTPDELEQMRYCTDCNTGLGGPLGNGAATTNQEAKTRFSKTISNIGSASPTDKSLGFEDC